MPGLTTALEPGAELETAEGKVQEEAKDRGAVLAVETQERATKTSDPLTSATSACRPKRGVPREAEKTG